MAKRALLVGLDVYPDPRNSLNSCVADTLAFKRLLLTSYGFAAEDITLLHNQNATLANVRSGLDALFATAQAGDQLVYFESSHGYQYPEGDTMIQVLCLYDQFLKDTELSTRTQELPPGVLTVVLDACHSGGMNKVFFPEGGVQLARAKVWQPSPEEAALSAQLYSQVSNFKFFGQKVTGDTAAVAKNFFVALPAEYAVQKDFDAGAVDLNAAMFAACQADQTAAAGCPATNNLSAFTFAVVSDDGGFTSLEGLCQRVVVRLNRLNMSQTPVALAPPTHLEQLQETFITMQQPSSPGVPVPVVPDPAAAGSGFDPAAWLSGQLAS